jgi:beta-glucosidase
MNKLYFATRLAATLMAGAGIIGSGASAQTTTPSTVDARADTIVRQLTPEEQLRLVHGVMALPFGASAPALPPGAIPGAGYIAGVPRLGVPALTETDASLGVAYVMGLRHDGATALPSGLATAATWDTDIAYQGGAMIGQEAWRKGFNVLLAGGVDLARDPRNGRNFEYLGEDPLLAGLLAGAAIRGIQAQHVVSTVKHYAVNDQETGRLIMNAVIGEAAARESDLLAFQIAIETGHPGSVMCAYNHVDGVYACENDNLLNKVLKQDWKYPGWVMSDWGAVHSLSAALRGLDQESGSQLDSQVFFDKPLAAAAERDPAYRARLVDMDHRIIRSLAEVGVLDHPAAKTPIDFAADAKVAERVEDEGIVLLKNRGDLLPLLASAKRIAVIGGHADVGVISGGGSSQVAPPGGPAMTVHIGGEGQMAMMRSIMYMPSSPLQAIKARAGVAEVHFDDGMYPAAAAAIARRSDVAIVFVTKWQLEGYDAPDLSLPDGQDQLVEAVTGANPHTIVVLETGNPVLMPWLDQAGAVLEAWYPGSRGGEAIADVLFGVVGPSGRLPITFPASLSQLPRPSLPGWGLPETQAFDVDYNIEGANVGYRWYAEKALKPLFPFGFGLSFTHFSPSDLKVQGGATVTASFNLTNNGSRPGVDVAQLYLTATPSGAHERLLGWSRIKLDPGETRRVTITADPRLLANWDVAAHTWRIAGGRYGLAIGASAADLQLSGSVDLAPRLP